MSQFAVAGRAYNIDEDSLTRPGRETDRQKLIDDYHRLWYDESVRGLTWGNMTYFGYKLWKMPSDLFLYQFLINSLRPGLLIETGTAFGGSALYYAHVMDQIGIGHVLTIDLNEPQKPYPKHPRIEYFGGKSSTDFHVVREVGKRVKWYGGPVVVSLDSNHAMEHVFDELQRYSQFVTPASYLVVEDENVNGHPVFPSHGPGPFEASEKFFGKHPEFVKDERLPATMLFSMHGWYRKERR